MNKTLNDWKKFLDPDEVKFQLVCASLYLSAYELLIDNMLKRVKDFYFVGVPPVESTYSEDYKKVRALYPKDIVIATAIWLKKQDAISQEDVAKITEFKKYRNEIAHEIPKMISDTSHDVKVHYIAEIRDIHYKIHKWWYVEFEADLMEHPELDVEPDIDEVLSLVMLPHNYFVNIANEEIKKRK